ncbi:AMP-binding protein (plasmid) [Aquicoccus sp. G2-2]|uniref:AMP-binding protein n=1 Tax=Aquicoccus sp. G2-2 TaxID=3092120 RepID=UPI002ADF99E0|nr:AMP-binding protein [Aquicoccus sp. G2-2]MEA1112091.1 AMP-binding protein [Aquicoccus sp. G2-2]
MIEMPASTDANFVPLSPLSFLKFAARTYPDRTAWIYEGRRTSYRNFNDRCRRLAAVLVELGVGTGDTVSVMAPNVPAMLEAHFAVPMIGAVLNTINTRQDAAHVEFIFRAAQPAVVIADVEFADIVRTALISAGHDCPMIRADDAAKDLSGEKTLDYETTLAKGASRSVAATLEAETAPIALNYTSGTSGTPKGVLHSHRAAYLNALGIALLWNMPTWPVFLWIVPLFHCNGWCMSWAVTARAGTHVLQRKVEASRIFEAIEAEGVTHLACAPTVLGMLLADPAAEGRHGAHTVEVATGGAPPSRRWITRMSQLGFNITQLYGMTETLSNSVYSAPTADFGRQDEDARVAHLSRQGVAQLAVDEVCLRDPQTGAALPHDGCTTGEVCIRSNTVMSGYFDDPDATDAALKGGWLHTGDLGVIHPDGYLELLDRAKDIIISGGENIASVEVERVLAHHDAIEEVAVVPMPDAKWGEVPCAFIRLKAGATLDAATLDAWSGERLPGFKRPKRYDFVEHFPYSGTGKVQKTALREMARLAAEDQTQKETTRCSTM